MVTRPVGPDRLQNAERITAMKFLFAIILAVILAEAELDIVAPSLPQLQDFLGVSVFQTELLLTVNLLAHGLSALFMGHLGDKLGKRRVLLGGTAVFILGSAFMVFFDQFAMLLLGRVLQGAGAAAPMVIGYVLAIEHASKASQANVMGVLNGVANTALALTPSIGSLGTVYFGWRGNFTILMVLGLVSLLLSFFAISKDKAVPGEAPAEPAASTGRPEGQPDPASGSLLAGYWHLLQDKRFVGHLLSTSILPGGWYVFIGMASIVYVEAMNVPLSVYAIHQGVIALSYGVFGFLSARVISALGGRLALLASIACLMLGCVVGMIAFAALPEVRSPVFITACMLLGSIGAVIPVNLTHIMAIEYDPGRSAKISALITMARWLIASIGIQTASWLYRGSFLSTAGVLTAWFLAGMLVMAWMCAKHPQFRTRLLSQSQTAGHLAH